MLGKSVYKWITYVPNIFIKDICQVYVPKHYLPIIIIPGIMLLWREWPYTIGNDNFQIVAYVARAASTSKVTIIIIWYVSVLLKKCVWDFSMLCAQTLKASIFNRPSCLLYSSPSIIISEPHLNTESTLITSYYSLYKEDVNTFKLT